MTPPVRMMLAAALAGSVSAAIGDAGTYTFDDDNVTYSGSWLSQGLNTADCTSPGYCSVAFSTTPPNLSATRFTVPSQCCQVIRDEFNPEWSGGGYQVDLSEGTDTPFGCFIASVGDGSTSFIGLDKGFAWQNKRPELASAGGTAQPDLEVFCVPAGDPCAYEDNCVPLLPPSTPPSTPLPPSAPPDAPPPLSPPPSACAACQKFLPNMAVELTAKDLTHTTASAANGECTPGNGVDFWYSGPESQGATSTSECYIMQGDKLRYCFAFDTFESYDYDERSCFAADTIGGDPVYAHAGAKVMVNSLLEHAMIGQDGLVLLGTAWAPTLISDSGDPSTWFMTCRFVHNTNEVVRFAVVDPATFPANVKSIGVTSGAKTLQTLRVFVKGVETAISLEAPHTITIQDSGSKTVVAISAERLEHIIIGSKRAEKVRVEATRTTPDGLSTTFRVSVSTSKAHKYAVEELRVLATHLDITFDEYDQTKATGVFPEIFGMAPMSKVTANMIKNREIYELNDSGDVADVV